MYRLRLNQMTESELQSICSEWQARLGLSHWHIAVGFARRKGMAMDDCDACVIRNLCSESAKIQILDPADYESDTGEAQDIEECLVHELLHIPMAYICSPENDTLLSIHVEAHIDRVAKAMVALKREGNGQPKE
jgi:endonuclease III